MKEKDLRPCDLCGKPLNSDADRRLSPIEAGARVTFQRMLLNGPALLQRVGLELMFGGTRPGAARIAQAFQPDDEFALEPQELRHEALLCYGCWMEHLGGLVEALVDRERRARQEAESGRTAERAAEGFAGR